MADSGEGRWTSIAAIDTSVPAPVLTTALYSRFTSRGEADFGSRVFERHALGLRRPRRAAQGRCQVSGPLVIQSGGEFDFLSLGGLVIRLDTEWIPFRKATSAAIHVSGAEFNVAANLC